MIGRHRHVPEMIAFEALRLMDEDALSLARAFGVAAALHDTAPTDELARREREPARFAAPFDTV